MDAGLGIGYGMSCIGNMRQIQRPPLTEDAKKIIERILADEGTQMKTGYRAALIAMCEAS